MRISFLSPGRTSSVVSLVGGFLLMSSGVLAQHTYYISKSTGSDSNTATQAQSKSTPWAHLPGMPSCMSNCASYTPVAGDSFILKGGDTWTASDLGVNWTNWGGTSTNCVLPYGTGATNSCIYIGVDQTWFTGASWTRPVFNCGGTSCTNPSNTGDTVIWLYGANYVVWDNIEITGYEYLGDGGFIVVNGTNTEIKNMYIHGWTDGGTGNDGYAITAQTNSGYSGAGTWFHDNVIDGSDTSQSTMNGFGNGDHIYNNVVRYVVSGLLVSANDLHSNLFEDSVVSAHGDHCNLVFNQGGPLTGSTIVAYNNVLRGSCAGGSVFWITGGTSSTVYYEFNNVMYNISNAFGGFSCGYHASAGNTGTCYMYNETIDMDGGAGGTPFGNGESGAASTQHYSNIHLIGSGGTLCNTTGATCVDDGNELLQTDAQADADNSPHFDQYSASQSPYALAPVASTNSTVGQGKSYATTFCATITSLNTTAGAACTLDTTYPEYNSTNHTVTFRTTSVRASWDIGAYNFAGTLAPPTNLTAVSH